VVDAAVTGDVLISGTLRAHRRCGRADAGSVRARVLHPGDDAHAGLRAYADLVVAAIGKRTDVTLVAQSMGGFSRPRAPAPLEAVRFS
jgi:hypothetical protein